MEVREREKGKEDIGSRGDYTRPKEHGKKVLKLVGGEETCVFE